LRRLIAALLCSALLFPVLAAPAAAATVTNCQDITAPLVFEAEHSHRTATMVNGAIAFWGGQTVNDPLLTTCVDASGTDVLSASSQWIAVTGSGPTEILQVGMVRCASGCDTDLQDDGGIYSPAGNDSNGNLILGIPNDNQIYLFYSWGGDIVKDGPNGSGPEAVRIPVGTAGGHFVQGVGGYSTPRLMLLRSCNQTDCLQGAAFQTWRIVWAIDGTDPLTVLAGSPTGSPWHGWLELNEAARIPWIANEATKATFACEVLDRGDQCGGNEAATLQSSFFSVQVKDWTVPPLAAANGWVNPKFTTPTCDINNMPSGSCSASTSSGGNPDSRVGKVVLETLNNR